MKARQETTKTFHIDYNSAQDGMRYKGDFTIKKLSIRDLSALGVRKAQLNGGMHFDPANPGRGVSEDTDDLNNTIAHLELSVASAPPWWDLEKVTDVGLLGAVFKEVFAFEQSFLARRFAKTKFGGNSEGSGSPNVQEANASGSAGAVVVEEVSSALEP